MDLIEMVKSLVSDSNVPAPVKDEEFPNEQAPNYWVDQSMSNGEAEYVVPEHITVPDTFRPTNEHNVPYRGVVDHGVTVTEPSIMVAPMPQELAEQRRDAAEKEAKASQVVEHVMAPIPVTVVEMPTPTAQDKRIVPAQYLLSATVAQKMAPRRQQRTRVTFSSPVGSGGLLIGGSQEIVQGGQGYLIPAGNQYESETTDEVWAMSGTGSITAYVIEEFTVTLGERET